MKALLDLEKLEPYQIVQELKLNRTLETKELKTKIELEVKLDICKKELKAIEKEQKDLLDLLCMA